MATEYRITIVQIDRDVPYTAKEWQQLVDVPDSKHPEIYGYVTTEKTKDVEHQVYQQLTDGIDLSAVIVAVNQTQTRGQQ